MLIHFILSGFPRWSWKLLKQFSPWSQTSLKFFLEHCHNMWSFRKVTTKTSANRNAFQGDPVKWRGWGGLHLNWSKYFILLLPPLHPVLVNATLNHINKSAPLMWWVDMKGLEIRIVLRRLALPPPFNSRILTAQLSSQTDSFHSAP